ncbi:hypothetical protein FUAX_54530 (plasmid) [Fulvitalea axinellae]|uniref:Initiator Rep protein WH1 domain-containing protein n=1 Tax=Fulvitalea axinellae TaxID=1182444 RepID=A0AAU9CVD6_9BACT|nr:hypothetical protein FUAX_54530 [Fulvitalea axinellae]
MDNNGQIDSQQLFDYKITKSNKLINHRSSFSIVQQRAITLAIAQIQPEDHDLKRYRISIRDVAGIKKGERVGGSVYKHVREQIMQLTKTSIDHINNPDDPQSGFKSTSFIEEVEKHDGKDYVTIEFSQKAKPLLLNLKERFTTYALRYVLDFEHSYTLRLYELCKQYERIGKRRISIEYFRELLNLTTKYPGFGKLRTKVIDPAVKEINSLSDMRVSYEPIRQGRAFTDIVFSIRPVEEIKTNAVQNKGGEGVSVRKTKKAKVRTKKANKSKTEEAKVQPKPPALEFSWDVGPETQPTEEELRQKYLADYERYYQEVRTDYLRRATREQKNAFQAHVHENGTIPERNCLERLVSGEADRTDWNMFATFVIRTQGADQDRRYLDPQAYVQDRLEEHNR